MPNCLKCNAYNTLGKIECKACGAILPADEGNDCPRCSKTAGPYAKTCRECGWDLSKDYNKISWGKIITWILIMIIALFIFIKL